MILYAEGRPALSWWYLKASAESEVEQLKRTECFQRFNEGIKSVIYGLFRRSVAILHNSLGKASFSDDDAVWDTDQVHLREHDAGSFIPVVEQNRKSRFLEFLVKGLDGVGNLFGFF